jgi:L-threonylcarbamoyladenylate synthase
MEVFEDDINHCLEVLRKGGLVLYPTDTIWGIGCDATSAEAVKKVFTIKKRDVKKSLIVLLADERDLLKYVAAPDPHIFSFLKTLEKPTTVIYDGAIGVADNLIHADGTIAIRLIKETFCRHLIKRFHKPIVSTSANISGQEPPLFFDTISDEVKKSVDYIVQYRRKDNTPQQPSAILRWNKDGSIKYIRK